MPKGFRAHKARMTPQEFEARKRRSAERKRKLAAKLDDEAMLIASIRFYLEWLLPDRTADAQEVHAATSGSTLKEKRHLTAARRLLGIFYRERGQIMWLPGNYYDRLARIGLDLVSDFDARAQFFALNPFLILDEAMTAFAFFRPIILDAKAFLGGAAWLESEKRFKPEPIKLDSYSESLQNYVMGELSLRRA
jgi:hypothetical protein